MKPIEFRTGFSSYTAGSILGEGGAGRVYGATDEQGAEVAIKVLDPLKATKERLKRFKNEYLFGFQNQHDQLLRVLDFGVIDRDGKAAPFYVMPKYAGSLRKLMTAGISQKEVLPVFAKLLSGIEAAHLLRVVHRDLKPENILANNSTDLVVGDFGIARFEEEELYTAVETKNDERLANFVYAAPEQRKRGAAVDLRADMFALGLMLNELFTSEIPQGTDFRTVGDVASSFSWVDGIVADLIRFEPSKRPPSIAALRELLRLRSDQFEAQQRLDALKKAVVPSSQIDDPLANEPPVLVGADFNGQEVILTFDQPLSGGWIDGLRNMGSYSSAWGADPGSFRFTGNMARVSSDGSNAQQIVDHFKGWLPKATAVYRQRLISRKQREEHERSESLRQQREALQRREQVRTSLKI